MIKKSLFILSLTACHMGYGMFKKNLYLDFYHERSVVKNIMITSLAINLIEAEKHHPSTYPKLLENSIEILTQYKSQTKRKSECLKEKLRAQLLRRKAELEKASKNHATIPEASSWPFCI
jgi:hypothetical protein